jgi:hypothetical protein
MKFVAFVVIALLTLANAQDDYSLNWYNDNTNAEEFEISTAADLRGLAVLVNKAIPVVFAGKTVKLANDIDLEGVNFTPIGINSGDNAFKGTFDGNGHTIRRLSIDSDKNAGLFGFISGNGEIKNVRVEVLKIKTSSSSAGGLVGYYVSTKPIDNCHVIADSIIANTNTGGLVGYGGGTSNITIQNSSSNTNVLSNEKKGYSGGLVGFFDINGGLIIKNSYTMGNVVGTYSGGLAGQARRINIESSYASGKISTNTNLNRDINLDADRKWVYYSGGLVGRTRDAEITRSYASGDVSATAVANYSQIPGTTTYHVSDSAYAGGLVGYVEIDWGAANLKITDSYASGNISVSRTQAGSAGNYSMYSGGLLGGAGGGDDKITITIENSCSNGKILNVGETSRISEGNSGGLIGELIGRNTGNNNIIVISNSYANGDVSAIHYSGGLIGYTSDRWRSITIDNSYFGGNILQYGNSANYRGGGIFGRYYYPGKPSPITSVYYNSKEAIQAAGWACNSSNTCTPDAISGISGKSSDDLKKQATFDGWDFTDVWGIFEDYTMPFLNIEGREAPSSSSEVTPSSSSESETPSSSSEDTPSSSSEGTSSSSSSDETPSSSSSVAPSSSSSVAPSSSSEDTPSSSSGDEIPSSSSEDTPSSSSGEDIMPIRLPQIASSNQATQIHNGINLQATRNAVVEIYGLDGKLIGRQNFGGGVYNVSLGYLPKGLYIVNASFGSEKKVLKVPVR